MSNKLVKKNRFENITFTELGLDEDFNFLEAPCCGCGNKMTLETDDIQQFCGDMLYEDECDWCGLFVIRLNGTVLVTLKTGCTEEDINFIIDDIENDYKEKSKEEFIKYVGNIYYTKYRCQEIYERLQEIECE